MGANEMTTSNLHLGIAGGMAFIAYLVLTIVVLLSPHLGVWWQGGLIILFVLGGYYSLKQLSRLEDRQKALDALEKISFVDNLHYLEEKEYIRKYLR